MTVTAPTAVTTTVHTDYASVHTIVPREGSFHRFQFPLNTFNFPNPSVPYEMIVFQYQGELYFFGHCVAHCLGHASPHEAIATMDSRFLHRIPPVSGIFLKKEGVLALEATVPRPTFLNWLEHYVK